MSKRVSEKRQSRIRRPEPNEGVYRETCIFSSWFAAAIDTDVLNTLSLHLLRGTSRRTFAFDNNK